MLSRTLRNNNCAMNSTSDGTRCLLNRPRIGQPPLVRRNDDLGPKVDLRNDGLEALLVG